jgi:hypothetical protein
LKPLNYIFALIGVLILSGAVWWFFFASPYDSSIDIIVSKQENPDGFYPSPAGDKIIYYSLASSKTILLFPEIGLTYELNDCRHYYWFDNITLYCLNQSVIQITDDNKLIQSQLNNNRVSEINLAEILGSAKQIYMIEGQKQILLFQPSEYHLISGFESITETLKGYNYLTVVGKIPDTEPQVRIFSPNKVYYFSRQRTTLTVYKAADDRELAKFETDNSWVFVDTSVWAADNSGVYFQTLRLALVFDIERRGEILKLKVPERILNTH